ncbi:GNAT family protein [Streptosporangium saharense]|uniref:RimJ/RimL family protein N-acetyltransferase n=1 Tax=Streptosporangium saharense TaxID=1706840 RepID=A0A7W7QHN8_9ACTN|nr:GNAT family protein [Streptosporangium saharense]MBB4913775.1 RimJ/RimL family protein N-acetyltransferase [Streptosporangium saharense]
MTLFAKKPVLYGSRVTLRPVGPEHAEGLWTLINDPETARLTGSHGVVDRAAIALWCHTRADQDDRLDLAICAADDDAYVGEVVLNDLDAHNLSCNLRIALSGPEVYGRGYGSEAIRLMLHHAFTTTDLHRIELEVFTFNERAAHVYRKAGFVEEGVRRDALLWEGRWHDAVVMSVLAPEWLAARV